MNALTYSWLLASLIVLPRFTRSRNNFEKHYRLLADAWSVYDNQAARQGCWKARNETKSQTSNQQRIFRRVGRPLRRAAKTARTRGTHATSGKRQGGRRKTLTYPAGALISMFSQFRKRGRLAPVREFEQIIPFMASLACSEAVRRFEPMNGPDPGNERGDRLGDLNL